MDIPFTTYGLWSFQGRDIKLESFLAKNQYPTRKCWYIWQFQFLKPFIFQSDAQFLMTRHYISLRNTIISFWNTYWFLAKNLSNFLSLHWKLDKHYYKMIYLQYHLQSTGLSLVKVQCQFASQQCSKSTILEFLVRWSKLLKSVPYLYRIHQMVSRIFCNFESTIFSRNWVCLFILLY